MLSPELAKGINEQLTFELYSGHIYLSMAAYCTDLGLDGFASFFIMHEREERYHAMKLYDYLADRDERIKLTGFEAPPVEFESILNVFEEALVHERVVTKRINDLMDIALADKDHASVSFLNWFVDEQVEEEAYFSGLIDKIKLIGDNGQGLLQLDAELGTRVFTPPAEEE